jgi:Glycosyltransferase family 87
VPALLLLVARDLLLHDPPRILAWRLLHDPRLQQAPAWLAALLPRTSPGFDRDPIALALAGVATGLGLVYLALAALGIGPRWRALVIAVGSAALVVAPSLAFTAIGLATDRPYGQDGGVVQLPLALDKILAGQSPYGADYSDTILGQQARSSAFWAPFGGNPILHHHAYLPGTHAIFMPFYLASKATIGVFDPRFVTLLAYVLVGWLASLLFESPPHRLVAAGVAALNPLVYWHQIFGANDLLLVALLLGAWLAADRGRPLLAGFLLGLACATKQLAWPFAPFLLLHLSGAREWGGLVARDTWKRLRGPVAVAGLTFAAIVAPVAALDPRAFYGDIVVYNVGLPGADNYPLGGTPGFGFANFLIYFGRVSSLREYFPFGGFYVLLVPLGLALVHAQMRESGLPRAFLNGSVALLASLYFSRVVHPNYLIPLAVLLPLALLARGRSADGAVVPLMLLAAGVEAVENGVFRLTWDQAVAAGWPRLLTGPAASLAPRSAAGLTVDPIGTGFSALAAGLALVYLIALALGASARLRLVLGAIAVALVVVLPTVLVVRVGDRTGIRGQDAWVVQTPADAVRIATGVSPYAEPRPDRPQGREAWSSSFRLEPPRVLAPTRPLVPPGAAVLGAAFRGVGLGDPRWLTLIALALVVALVGLCLSDPRRPDALGVLALSLPVVLGAAFGSPVTLAALLICAAWLTSRAAPAGGLLGAAAAVCGPAWAAAPFLCLRGGRDQPAATRSVLVAFAAVLVVLGLPAVFPDPRAFLSALSRPDDVTPGLGLANFVLYRGAENEPFARVLFAMAPLLVAAFVAFWWRRRPVASPEASAALAVLLGLFLFPSISPDAVALPILLAALPFLRPEARLSSEGKCDLARVAPSD